MASCKSPALRTTPRDSSNYRTVGTFYSRQIYRATTNAPNEHGGRFRIEAHVEPIVASDAMNFGGLHPAPLQPSSGALGDRLFGCRSLGSLVRLTRWLSLSSPRSRTAALLRERAAQLAIARNHIRTAMRRQRRASAIAIFGRSDRDHRRRSITTAYRAGRRHGSAASCCHPRSIWTAAQSKNGFLSLAATIEIAQPALQSLLYDLESGLPFIFVDSFEIHAPEAVGRTAKVICA